MDAFIDNIGAIASAVERLEESESCRDPFEIVADKEEEQGCPLCSPKGMRVVTRTTITITIVTERRIYRT